jgi:hypothetical protein
MIAKKALATAVVIWGLVAFGAIATEVSWGDELPGVSIGFEEAISVRAGQSGIWDCVVTPKSKACTGTGVTCAADPEGNCTAATGGQTCGTCTGNQPKTCVAGTTLPTCTTRNISCCTVNTQCATTNGGCLCNATLNNFAIGANTTCP